jgi:type II secretion system protein N
MARLPIRLPNLGPRTRKVVRIFGFIVLFLVTFVFALQWTFPFHRVRDKIVEVLSAKYEVTIPEDDGIERGLIPGRVYFNKVTLRTRPAKADDVPTTFFIHRLKVDVGLFALIGGKASVDIDAEIAGGHITGNIGLSKSMTSIHVDGKSLPSASLPMREAIGLPMSGKVNFAFNLDLPNDKLKNGRAGPNWEKATGNATFECPTGCTFGDGKTKLKPKLKNSRNQAFAEGGIEFGKLNVTTLIAKIDIARGTLKVTKFDTKSDDGKLFIDFSMKLERDIGDSIVEGCLRFDGSTELLKRDPRTHAAISTTGAPKAADGLFHIKLEGKVKEMRRLGKECTGSGGESKDVPSRDTSRPSITIQPEHPPADAAAPQFTPPPPPPPADAAEAADAAVTVPVPHPEGEHPAGSAGSAAGAGSSSAMPTPAPPPAVPEGMR